MAVEILRLAFLDIGLSRCDAEFEASKPFWMA
jgi:uncharacterized protein YjiS (DUF1127 family)